ncbi:MAG: hypothetical protein PHG65_10040 [Kiritimatiellae bacterium]|nr:hypothetical protein [Kiritimatiellia bacterium]
MRSRDIARKLTVNKAIECERVGERKMLALPSSVAGRSQRFGRGPSILATCFSSFRSGVGVASDSHSWFFSA